MAAKYLLEVAVVLLGVSVSAATILAAGLPLVAGIAGVVASAILLSFGIGRLLGLPTRMALLVACGKWLRAPTSPTHISRSRSICLSAGAVSRPAERQARRVNDLRGRVVAIRPAPSPKWSLRQPNQESDHEQHHLARRLRAGLTYNFCSNEVIVAGLQRDGLSRPARDR